MRHPLSQPVNERLSAIQWLTRIVVNEICAHILWPRIKIAALPEIVQPIEHQLLVCFLLLDVRGTGFDDYFGVRHEGSA
ncbi:MAG: hypothetical protein ABSE43_10675 [Steroidobacteraceae bacterium]